MKVNSVSDQMGCLKFGDLTCIHCQQNLADSAAQRRVLTVERPDQAVPAGAGRRAQPTACPSGSAPYGAIPPRALPVRPGPWR